MLLGSAAIEAAANLAARMARRVDISVSRTDADSFQHLREARCTAIDTLSRNGDDVCRREGPRHRPRKRRARRRGGWAAWRAQIGTKKEYDAATEAGTTEMNVRLRHGSGKISVRQHVVDGGTVTMDGCGKLAAGG